MRPDNATQRRFRKRGVSESFAVFYGTGDQASQGPGGKSGQGDQPGLYAFRKYMVVMA